MLDLTTPGATRLLADHIKGDIDRVTTKPGKYSWRIKPSSLGGDCVAKIWYAFRWVRKSTPPPRIQRIFDVGNAFEQPIVDWLRAAGWELYDKDPSKIGSKFEQWNFKALDGHMSAYLDGIGAHSERTGGVFGNIEAKSYNKRRFNMLTNKVSVKAADYEYYVQACIYMMGYNLPFTVLVAVCKDDGDVHIDVFLRDDETAMRALSIGDTIKNSRVRPARIAQSAAFHKCKECPYVGVCHLGELPDKNCRSCVHSVPIEGGKFGCSRHNCLIPDETAINTYPTQCGTYEAVA